MPSVSRKFLDSVRSITGTRGPWIEDYIELARVRDAVSVDEDIPVSHEEPLRLLLENGEKVKEILTLKDEKAWELIEKYIRTVAEGRETGGVVAEFIRYVSRYMPVPVADKVLYRVSPKTAKRFSYRRWPVNDIIKYNIESVDLKKGVVKIAGRRLELGFKGLLRFLNEVDRDLLLEEAARLLKEQGVEVAPSFFGLKVAAPDGRTVEVTVWPERIELKEWVKDWDAKRSYPSEKILDFKPVLEDFLKKVKEYEEKIEGVRSRMNQYFEDVNPHTTMEGGVAVTGYKKIKWGEAWYTYNIDTGESLLSVDLRVSMPEKLEETLPENAVITRVSPRSFSVEFHNVPIEEAPRVVEDFLKRVEELKRAEAEAKKRERKKKPKLDPRLVIAQYLLLEGDVEAVAKILGRRLRTVENVIKKLSGREDIDFFNETVRALAERGVIELTPKGKVLVMGTPLEELLGPRQAVESVVKKVSFALLRYARWKDLKEKGYETPEIAKLYVEVNPSSVVDVAVHSPQLIDYIPEKRLLEGLTWFRGEKLPAPVREKLKPLLRKAGDLYHPSEMTEIVAAIALDTIAAPTDKVVLVTGKPGVRGRFAAFRVGEWLVQVSKIEPTPEGVKTFIVYRVDSPDGFYVKARTIKEAVKKAAPLYRELQRLGHDLYIMSLITDGLALFSRATNGEMKVYEVKWGEEEIPLSVENLPRLREVAEQVRSNLRKQHILV